MPMMLWYLPWLMMLAMAGYTPTPFMAPTDAPQPEDAMAVSAALKPAA